MGKVLIYLNMNTTPDNTRMKTNNEAAVIPTKASEDKSEKIQTTEHYIKIKSLYMYRGLPNIVTEEAGE